MQNKPIANGNSTSMPKPEDFKPNPCADTAYVARAKAFTKLAGIQHKFENYLFDFYFF
jgi:hypothetical protein